MKPFKVNIVTPEKVAWEAEAVSVILPGSLGYLGIWANHAPLVSGLEPGVVTIRLDDTGTTRYLSCGGGFVEVSDNVVNVMTDSCEEAGEIDGHRARAALARAKERLLSRDAAIDKERALLARQRAEARLKVLDLMEK
ncbi:MAG: ATP synthase F1 subunit epsilon [Candidatus Krumholzibacteria bacterium]|nr:ATP synthase F1 subunit epsilon [Candidatus Krumholzibacteria bacterium]